MKPASWNLWVDGGFLVLRLAKRRLSDHLTFEGQKQKVHSLVDTVGQPCLTDPFSPDLAEPFMKAAFGRRSAERHVETICGQIWARPFRLLASAKKPTAPERAIRGESSGHSKRAALGAFQRDLLGQHDVSDRQIAHRQKT